MVKLGRDFFLIISSINEESWRFGEEKFLCWKLKEINRELI